MLLMSILIKYTDDVSGKTLAFSGISNILERAFLISFVNALNASLVALNHSES